ncbi:unnamed protein product, partial [Rotaria sp. Silwood1]
MEETAGRMKQRVRDETTSVTKIYSQEVGKTKLENRGISSDLTLTQHGNHSLLAAIRFTFIPPSLFETTWISLMNEYTPTDYQMTLQFTDFMVSTYAENGSAR